jgi:signal transduction histidine kinase
MDSEFQSDIARIGRIAAVPTILEVVCRTTGMGFAAVARVTEDRWVACSVLDEINFGLKPGGELRVETTICHEIRECREAVIIDDVAEDEAWRDHATPAMYGFRSYISMPIILADGAFFGTLCAIDPRPARVRTPETIGMFKLFAELIASHLNADRKLAATETDLQSERTASELREQFIAVLGHDLRNPVSAIASGTSLLQKMPLDKKAMDIVGMMRDSAFRMSVLINDVLDFARGRLGGGLPITRNAGEPLEPVLREVIAELAVSNRSIEAEIALLEPVNCDRARIGQLLSNLLGNALTHGSSNCLVRVRAISDGKGFELSVSNAGVPIRPASLERLFQPFYRGTDGPDRQGLGLGLYIAHEIAIAHGGTLKVSSSEEETRFTFRMPASGA